MSQAISVAEDANVTGRIFSKKRTSKQATQMQTTEAMTIKDKLVTGDGVTVSEAINDGIKQSGRSSSVFGDK